VKLSDGYYHSHFVRRLTLCLKRSAEEAEEQELTAWELKS
jgi:hypothetical protein